MNFLVNLLFPLLLIGTAMPGELFPVTLVQNPTLQATFTKCQGIATCKYCCVTFKTSLQGRIEYRMHKIYQGGQIEPTEYGSHTGGNNWNYGIVGDPDPFVIKYRNVGSNTWHQSHVITPPKYCCYP